MRSGVDRVAGRGVAAWNLRDVVGAERRGAAWDGVVGAHELGAAEEGRVSLRGVARARLDRVRVGARAHEVAATDEVLDRGGVRAQGIVALHERGVREARV